MFYYFLRVSAFYKIDKITKKYLSLQSCEIPWKTFGVLELNQMVIEIYWVIQPLEDSNKKSEVFC